MQIETEGLKIISAHKDHKPTHADLDLAQLMCEISTDDYRAMVLKGVDDSGFIYWTDFVANEWCEHYEEVSTAMARLAALQACQEADWNKFFMQEPKEFAKMYLEFQKTILHLSIIYK